MKKVICVFSLLAFGAHASDPKASIAMDDCLQLFETGSFEEAVKVANALRGQSGKYPENPHFEELRSTIAAVFTIQKKIIDAETRMEGLKLNQDRKTQGELMRESAGISRDLEQARGELQDVLRKEAIDLRNLFAEGYTDPAKKFAEVLSKVALTAKVDWKSPTLAESSAGGSGTSDTKKIDLMITLDDGSTKTYKAVSFGEVLWDGVMVKHSGGAAKVAFTSLPEPFRSKFEQSKPAKPVAASPAIMAGSGSGSPQSQTGPNEIEKNPKLRNFNGLLEKIPVGVSENSLNIEQMNRLIDAVPALAQASKLEKGAPYRLGGHIVATNDDSVALFDHGKASIIVGSDVSLLDGVQFRDGKLACYGVYLDTVQLGGDRVQRFTAKLVLGDNQKGFIVIRFPD